MLTTSIRLVLFFLLLPLLTSLHAATYHVSVRGNDNNSGMNWNQSFRTLQRALERAEGGDQIWVRAGVYTPTQGTNTPNDRNKYFLLKNGVTILGGFPEAGNPGIADRNPRFARTILSGDIGVPNERSDNSIHIFAMPYINSSVEMTIDGFYFEGANSPSRGGAIFAHSKTTNLAINNCVFRNNTAIRGSAIHAQYNNSLTLTNCEFSGNTTTQEGGAIFVSQGQLTITNSQFKGNQGSWGGALYAGSQNVQIQHSVFSGNVATAMGGAIYTDSKNLKMEHATLSGNQSASGSRAAFVGRIVKLDVSTSIIWGNTGSIEIENNIQTNVQHSIIQGGYSGTGNLNTDPLFVYRPAPGLSISADLRLQPCSPAIGIAADGSDLGAYPAQANTSVRVAIGSAPSFGNFDGVYQETTPYTFQNGTCTCWVRSDQQYAIGRIGNSWYVFRNSTCPDNPSVVANALIQQGSNCDVTTVTGISSNCE